MLYDNEQGYSTEALRIINHARDYVAGILLEHPEHNALELIGLIQTAVSEAHTEVSLKRRFDI